MAPGDRVAAQTDKSWPALVLYLGCLRAGAVYLPLNPAYTGTEVEYFLRDAEPSVFVRAPERGDLEPMAQAAGVAHVETMGRDGTGTLLSAAAEQAPDRLDVERKGSDLAAILYTSGYHRPLQGRHAHPRQPALQRARRWSTAGASPAPTC